MNLIIDGSSLLHRSHWINKTRDKQSEYDDIYIFLNSLRFYAKQFSPDSIYIAWDKKLLWPSTNFRKTSITCEYKAHRDKDAASEVFECEDKLFEITSTLCCKNIYPRTMEADDVIAWLCHNLEGIKVVVTADNDMLQLVNKDTKVFLSRKKTIINEQNFEKEIGIPLKYFLPYKAILGDKSDNINGVAGYGKKKAVDFAKIYKDNTKPIIQEHLNIIENNLKLMDLSKGYIIAGEEEVKCYNEQMAELTYIQPDLSKFKAYCKEYKFNSFLDKFDEWRYLFKGSRLMDILSGMKSE
jgi:DNA polymerase-1